MSSLNLYLQRSPENTVVKYLQFTKYEIDFYFSYLHAGLHGSITNHTRKDQRHYQRKFCSWLSRYDRIKNSYPEEFI